MGHDQEFEGMAFGGFAVCMADAAALIDESEILTIEPEYSALIAVSLLLASILFGRVTNDGFKSFLTELAPTKEN